VSSLEFVAVVDVWTDWDASVVTVVVWLAIVFLWTKRTQRRQQLKERQRRRDAEMWG
jgi:hypothetical protein